MDEGRHRCYIFDQLCNHYWGWDSSGFRTGTLMECLLFSVQVSDKSCSFKICIYSALVLLNTGLFNNGHFHSRNGMAVTEENLQYSQVPCSGCLNRLLQLTILDSKMSSG